MTIAADWATERGGSTAGVGADGLEAGKLRREGSEVRFQEDGGGYVPGANRNRVGAEDTPRGRIPARSRYSGEGLKATLEAPGLPEGGNGTVSARGSPDLRDYPGSSRG